jgi:hypothetical protein
MKSETIKTLAKWFNKVALDTMMESLEAESLEEGKEIFDIAKACYVIEFDLLAFAK